MRYLKIIFFSLFILSALYTCYSLSILSFDGITEHLLYKSADTLPNTIFLNTENGKISFHRRTKNKYCSQNQCGFVQKLTDNSFVFKWEKSITLKFLSTNDKNVYIQKDLNQKTPVYKPQSFTFNLNNNGEILNLTCIKKNCYDKQKETPFRFIIGGKHISQTTAFEKSYNIYDSERIILEKEGQIKSYQKDANDIYQEINVPLKENRFLIIISSYKRPIYLTGLIHRLFLQTYHSKNFDISISVKGLHKDVIKNILQSDLQNFIANKRLLMREDENKSRFSNMLDSFRDIDLKKYDYIVKMDDDDWYHKDYLKNLNLYINTFKNPAFVTSGILYSLKKQAKEVYLSANNVSRTGPSILFSNTFAKNLLHLENSTISALKDLKNPFLPIPLNNAYEDMILNAIAHQNGEKYLYFTLEPLFIYNQTNTPIMRPQN